MEFQGFLLPSVPPFSFRQIGCHPWDIQWLIGFHVSYHTANAHGGTIQVTLGSGCAEFTGQPRTSATGKFCTIRPSADAGGGNTVNATINVPVTVHGDGNVSRIVPAVKSAVREEMQEVFRGLYGDVGMRFS